MIIKFNHVIFSEHKEREKMLYIVMEKGETDLQTFFRKRRQLGNLEGFTWIYWREMLEAVQILHREGKQFIVLS